MTESKLANKLVQNHDRPYIGSQISLCVQWAWSCRRDFLVSVTQLELSSRVASLGSHCSKLCTIFFPCPCCSTSNQWSSLVDFTSKYGLYLCFCFYSHNHLPRSALMTSCLDSVLVTPTPIAVCAFSVRLGFGSSANGELCVRKRKRKKNKAELALGKQG